MERPLLLAPKTFEPGLECGICTDRMFIPVQSCDRHSLCYQCLWSACYIKPTFRDWDAKSVRFYTSCPLCKQNRIEIVAADDVKVSLRGIRRIPDVFISQLYPKQDYPCPFCEIYKGDMVTLTSHVDRCPKRPLRCPSKLCKKDFTIETGWKHHVREHCTPNL